MLLKQVSILICILFDEKKFKVNTRLNLHAYRVSSRLKAFAKKLLRSIENKSYVSRYQIKTATCWKVFSFWSHPKKNLEFYDPNNFTTLSIHWRTYCLADVVWCIKNVCPLTFQSCVKCWQTLISLIYLQMGPYFWDLVIFIYNNMILQCYILSWG